MAEAHDAVEVIVAKRDGAELTDSQIDRVIDAYTRGVVADEQMSALNMAILLNGMNRRTHPAGRDGRRPRGLAPRRRNEELLMPCGRCRQQLWENGGPELEVLTTSGVRPMSELLPEAFGSDALDLA